MSSGGYKQTLKDFDSLGPTKVKVIKTKYGDGKVGTLIDGTSIVACRGSKTAGTALEIRISNSKIFKLDINEVFVWKNGKKYLKEKYQIQLI